MHSHPIVASCQTPCHGTFYLLFGHEDQAGGHKHTFGLAHCRCSQRCGPQSLLAQTPTLPQVDLEAWFPASGVYRELVSASNCTDYQVTGYDWSSDPIAAQSAQGLRVGAVGAAYGLGWQRIC
jgi:hypothetical protein